MTDDLHGKGSLADWLSQARSQMANRDFQSARRSLGQVLAIDSKHSEAQRLLSELEVQEKGRAAKDSSGSSYQDPMEALEAGHLSTAIEMLGKFYPDIGETVALKPSKPRVEEPMVDEPSPLLLQSIEQDLDCGLIEEALAGINPLLQEFPNHPKLLQLEERASKSLRQRAELERLRDQSETYISQERYDEALSSLDSATRISPDDVRLKGRLAEVLLLRCKQLVDSDWRAAEQLLQQARSLEPHNVEGGALYRLLQERKREEIVSSALSRADELRTKDQLESAEQALREGLEEFPKEPRLQDALDQLLAFKQRSVADRLTLQAEQEARKLIDKGDYLAAEARLSEVLQRYPDVAALQELLNSVREGARRASKVQAIKGALESIRALEAQANLPGLRSALSLAKEILGRFPGERRILETQARLDQTLRQCEQRVDRLRTEGDECIARRDLKAALQCASDAIRLSPEDPDLRAWKREIEKQLRRTYWTDQKTMILVGGAVVLVILAVVGGLILFKPKTQFSDLSIDSKPTGAKVYLDGEEKGVTPFQTRVQFTGNDYLLRFKVQLDNYRDHEGTKLLKAGQGASIGPIVLEAKGLSPEQTAYQQAVQARKEGRLVPPDAPNALDMLNHLLEMNSEPAIALRPQAEALKKEIKKEFLDRLESLPRSDSKSEKALELLEKAALVDPDDNEIRKQIGSFPNIIDRLKRRIEEAVDAGRLLGAESGSALSLLKQLNRTSPTRERQYYVVKRSEIRDTVLRIAKEKCKVANDECASFVNLALNDFPQDSDLSKVKDLVAKSGSTVAERPADDRLDRLKELVKRAETAFGARHYVSPERDNAYYYASEALKLDNGSPESSRFRDRAQDLASESHRQALGQINELANGALATALDSPEAAAKYRADLQKASELFEKVRLLEKVDPSSTISPSDITSRAKDLDDLLSLYTYNVVHNHTFGSCKGRITISGHTIRYETEEPKDSFAGNYSQLREMRVNKNGELELLFADRKREFRPEVADKGRTAELVNEMLGRLKHFQQVRQRLSRR